MPTTLVSHVESTHKPEDKHKHKKKNPVGKFFSDAGHTIENVAKSKKTKDVVNTVYKDSKSVVKTAHEDAKGIVNWGGKHGGKLVDNAGGILKTLQNPVVLLGLAAVAVFVLMNSPK